MSEFELAILAERWIAHWKALEDSAKRKNLAWVMDREYDLVHEEPDQAWLLVLEILKQNNTSEILEVLSAGPLEDLLANHGELLIERVESEARGNPSFAKLLGGVWKSSMTDETWSRINKVWDRKGWDGIPEA